MKLGSRTLCLNYFFPLELESEIEVVVTLVWVHSLSLQSACKEEKR